MFTQMQKIQPMTQQVFEIKELQEPSNLIGWKRLQHALAHLTNFFKEKLNHFVVSMDIYLYPKYELYTLNSFWNVRV